jgi:ferredoxin|tara:strand:- start:6726 stop:6917 length:192 start_codon:yes stop_codon:yes gene_type:complete
MRIEVDWDLCESNAVCVQICPDLFSIDEKDNLIIATDSPDDELRDQVEQAVSACPRQAMRLDD